MALPIFSPSQAKKESEVRYEQDMRRAQRLAALTDEILKEKAEAERIWEEARKEQQKEAEAWFADQNLRKNRFLREIEELEERRKLALQPPLIKAEDIHTVEDALHARKLELDAREQDVQEEARALMRRLDDLETKETDYKAREKRLKVKEEGVEVQRKEVAHSAKRLNETMAQFQKMSQEQEEEYAFRKSEQDARENLLNERDARFKEREREIEAAHILLDDRRKLLDKGFDELQRLKQRYGSRN